MRIRVMGFARGGSNPSVIAFGRAWMAEWSKAADLSSVIFGCVGSNPTSGKQSTSFFYLSEEETGIWLNWKSARCASARHRDRNPVSPLGLD